MKSVKNVQSKLERVLSFIEALHGERTMYVSLGLVIFITEMYLAYRAAYVVYNFFSTHAQQEGALPVSSVVFLSTLGTGYVMATHPTQIKDWRKSWMLFVAIAAEWSSVFYLVYHGGPVISDNYAYDILQGAIFVSLCLATLLPFGLGVRMEMAHAAIAEEKRQKRQAYVEDFTFHVEQLAMAHLYTLVHEEKNQSHLLSYLPSALQRDIAQFTGQGAVPLSAVQDNAYTVIAPAMPAVSQQLARNSEKETDEHPETNIVPFQYRGSK